VEEEEGRQRKKRHSLTGRLEKKKEKVGTLSRFLILLPFFYFIFRLSSFLALFV